MKQDDDDTGREIRDEDSEDPGEPNVSSDIREDNLDNQQWVLHLDQAGCAKALQTTRVPLPEIRNCADTVIARTFLPNLQHPARAIAPPLLKRQKLNINVFCESDIAPSQALPPRRAGGDQSVPQPKASGDHNIPQHQKATFEVAKQFREAIIFTMTPWPIISDEKYSMVDEDSQLAIEAQDRQPALAGTPEGTPTVDQLPGGPSLEIDPQN